jgi:LAO/AO transport system kinase
VLKSVGPDATGVAELVSAIDRHFVYLEQSGALRERRRHRLRDRVRDAVDQRVRRRLWDNPETGEWLNGEMAALEAGQISPFAVADALLARSGSLLSGARLETLE